MTAEWLKGCGLSAKEVALKADLDVRTVQNAFAGHCGLETYGALMDAFEYDFVLPVAEKRLGRDQIEAWEARLSRERAEIEAAERRLDRVRAASRARGAVADGGLRLVGEPDRSWTAPLGIEGGNRSAPEAPQAGLNDDTSKRRT